METWQNFLSDMFYICISEIILLTNFKKLLQLQL